jgi:hypothetical protein
VASIDHGIELKQRRDQIVEKLYATSVCRNCDVDVNGGGDIKNQVKEIVRDDTGKSKIGSPSTPQSGGGGDDDEEDPYAGLFDDDDEQKTILGIKEQLEDPDQSEESVVDLLQSLDDMDITLTVLKETDIGRQVNQFRKHPSNDIRRIVKQLNRKWKDLVDEWVKLGNQGEVGSAALMVEGYSPEAKIRPNGHLQAPDFGYSSNPHNGSSGSDKNDSAPERKPKPTIPRREAPSKPSLPASRPASASYNRPKEQSENTTDSDRLASARKRLQESYKEADKAKKQRTIQVMDIRELPKQKNTFFAKNRGGSSQGRRW